MDETSSLQHPSCLEFLEMDEDSLCHVVSGIQRSGNVSFEKYFSRIMTLQLNAIFSDLAGLECGRYMMLVASQSLTTLGLLEHWRSKFSPLDLVLHLRFTHNRVALVRMDLPHQENSHFT